MHALLQLNPNLSLLLGGLILGFGFGFLVQRTNFCAMGAVSDMVVFGDARRMRAWLLAGAVAILGVHGLAAISILDLESTRYLSPRFNWFGNLVGGFVFGIGMVLAGGCASRNLVRAGSGDLRALLMLLVNASFAFATISGAFGQIRVSVAQATMIDLQAHGLTTQHMGDVLAGAFGAISTPDHLTTNRRVMALITGLGMLGYVFAGRDFRTSPRHMLSGVGIGLLVIAAFALTSLAFDDFADHPSKIQALSFVAPLGEAINWFERATALGLPGFGAASVFGALLGSFVSAKTNHSFKLQTFADPRDTLRHLGGSALMGMGGVLALGCTIGQGVSGVSTLAIGSVLAMAAIITGAVVTLKAMMT